MLKYRQHMNSLIQFPWILVGRRHSSHSSHLHYLYKYLLATQFSYLYNNNVINNLHVPAQYLNQLKFIKGLQLWANWKHS